MTLASFFSSWELFGTAALAGAVVGALLGFLGVYVVVRRMVFLSAALSQAAGLGVAITLLLGAPPALGAAAAAGIAAAPFFFSSGQALRREGWMGLLSIVGGAGALAVGTRLVHAEDMHGVLLGSAVVVLPDQLDVLVGLAAVITVLHVWWQRAFFQVSLDRDGSRVRGLPLRFLDGALWATLVIAIAASTRALGALPVFAFSVLPAMAALRLVSTLPRALLLAALLGAAGGFGGYILAFLYALPVGASQALVCAAFVVGAAGVARVRRGR